MLLTPHPRNSIIRFNALAAETRVAPLPHFGAPRYSSCVMKVHMETTMRNLAAGKGSWDDATQTSTTATYTYVDDPRPLLHHPLHAHAHVHPHPHHLRGLHHLDPLHPRPPPPRPPRPSTTVTYRYVDDQDPLLLQEQASPA